MFTTVIEFLEEQTEDFHAWEDDVIEQGVLLHAIEILKTRQKISEEE